mmetsp:Transcript_113195/g.344428  ORF Transcript_113195/g.344428 Transcript_113195/m.344428 type:complete len:142 (+) Transcript_113195:39-464(+)
MCSPWRPPHLSPPPPHALGRGFIGTMDSHQSPGELLTPQLQALLRAAAQAICDSGSAVGETADSVEEALLARVHASGAASVNQVALLGTTERQAGTSGTPSWRLSITGAGGPGVCRGVAGAEDGRGGSAWELDGKRRRVVA